MDKRGFVQSGSQEIVETDKPKTVIEYDIRHACGDMAGLLDALDLEKAVFASHDWWPVIPQSRGIVDHKPKPIGSGE